MEINWWVDKEKIKNQTELAVRKFKQVSDRTFGSHIEHNNHYRIIYKEFRDNDLDVQQQNWQWQQPWQDNYLKGTVQQKWLFWRR
jgi:hypothetical protein